MNGWNPSYDFRLFDIGAVSPLQAGEFGAATMFRASDPTAFVDFSLNQLRDLLNPRAASPFPQRQLPGPIAEVPYVPFFQGAEDVRERLRRTRDEADRLCKEAGGCQDRPSIYDIPGNVRRGAEVIAGAPGNVAKGAETVANAPGNVAKGAKVVKDFWDAIPAGAGIFLIAVAALIFIFLFAAKK